MLSVALEPEAELLKQPSCQLAWTVGVTRDSGCGCGCRRKQLQDDTTIISKAWLSIAIMAITGSWKVLLVGAINTKNYTLP